MYQKDKLKLYTAQACKFITKYPEICMLGYENGMRKLAIAAVLSVHNESIYQAYKRKVQEEMRKERKRVHNKKKSDRMKRLRVKKEKKRA